jgi:Fic family protein
MDQAAGIPEPLCVFDDKAPGLQAALAGLTAVHARYLKELRRGGILPNSVEAVRVELTYHSNAIEGSTLTLLETLLAIEGQKPQEGKSLLEVHKAHQHDVALQLIEAWVAATPAKVLLSEEVPLKVYGRMHLDLDIDAADRFIARLPAMLELANRPHVHPAVRAAELHYNVIAEHSFNDKDGRTARLLMNYLLLRHEFPHTVVEVERRGEYLAALEEANAGRWESFAVFIIGCIERSIVRLIGSE